MGTRGPVPKRSEERRRRNKGEGPEPVAAPSGPPPDAPVLPEPDNDWHPVASDWYLSLRESGQAAFYQPSDWAVARYVAELMSRALSAERPNGQLIAAINSTMSSLLTTEGDRRRARIELERQRPVAEQQPAGVTAIADYRAALGG
ncbi:phage terminase small subunit [Streptomyces xiamenensis]